MPTATDPGKPYLKIPFEIRQNILNFACAEAATSIRLQRKDGGLAKVTRYDSASEHAIVFVCRQMLFEGRPVLLKHVSLHLSCDFEEVAGFYLQEALGKILLQSLNSAPFLGYVRPSIQNLTLKFDEERVSFIMQARLAHVLSTKSQTLHLDILRSSSMLLLLSNQIHLSLIRGFAS
jgi:hypothetical protein